MTKAAELGFQLAKPLGDTAQYDVVLDLGGRFISVQVKSTFFQASNLKPGNFVASLFHVNGPKPPLRAIRLRLPGRLLHSQRHLVHHPVRRSLPQTRHPSLPRRQTKPVGTLPRSLVPAPRPRPRPTPEARPLRPLRHNRRLRPPTQNKKVEARSSTRSFLHRPPACRFSIRLLSIRLPCHSEEHRDEESAFVPLTKHCQPERSEGSAFVLLTKHCHSERSEESASSRELPTQPEERRQDGEVEVAHKRFWEGPGFSRAATIPMNTGR